MFGVPAPGTVCEETVVRIVKKDPVCSRGWRSYLSLLLSPVPTGSLSLGKLWKKQERPLPFLRRPAWPGAAVCPTAVWSAAWTIHTTQPTFTLTRFTVTHFPFCFNAASYWAKGSCCSWTFFFFPPYLFREMQSQQKGLNQEQTLCFPNRYNTAGDSAVRSHWCLRKMFHQSEGRWQELVLLLLLLTRWLF